MANQYYIITAISNLDPNAAVSVSGDTWADVEWQGTPSLTEAQVMTEAQRLEDEFNANEYQRLRKEAYPSIEEQLDMQYWDNINGTTVWQDTINAIKAQYPKP